MHALEMVVTRIFSSVPIHMELAPGGMSTSVFRVIYPHETFYLRLLPDAHDSFASEVAVHTQLHQKQVKVPEVIYFAHFDETLQRSVMVTTAIKGSPVIQSHSLGEDALQAIVMEAGRDLAQINTISVDGFGRLRGQVKTEQLSAPYPTYRAFVLADWESYESCHQR